MSGSRLHCGLCTRLSQVYTLMARFMRETFTNLLHLSMYLWSYTSLYLLLAVSVLTMTLSRIMTEFHTLSIPLSPELKVLEKFIIQKYINHKN